MKITVLVEDTGNHPQLKPEHGLSLYIETEKHKLLMDTGATDRFALNADLMGIDLSKVDTVVISHGHYDHGGGLQEFLKRNQTAKIYIREEAFAEYYHFKGKLSEEENALQRIESGENIADFFKYVGLDGSLKGHPQFVMLSEDTQIDDELFLFSGVSSHDNWSKTNDTLRVRTDCGWQQDTFSHEQGLVICENGKTVLLSGCAHSGIANIMKRYCELFDKAPDYAVSGFHLMRTGNLSKAQEKEARKEAKDSAERLMKYDTTYTTCHCTGLPAYEVMKEIMGEQIHYISTGMTQRF